MMNWLKNPAIRFFLIAFFLYLLWFLVYETWLHPLGTIDSMAIGLIISHGSFILSLLGYELFDPNTFGEGMRTLGIVGSGGVWVGDPCNGISLVALFAGFVMAFPGKLKNKLWFIPLGILSIHILNVLRVVALCIIDLKWPHSLEFNHTYTFTILVYSWVFALWYLWSNKLSKK
ncbi:MAG: hypothetical protein KDC83_06860 [Flavobacteriales bacterium]|nr:hypothetical protein [Flavobacteriales bacterium]